MITMHKSGNLNIPPPDFVETLGARSVASTSRKFIEYLRNRRFDELFDNETGETRASINTYRYKRSKVPTYIVRAGVGIPGNLNYLAGLYRGKAMSRSGKAFNYAKRRDLINEGWAAWGGERELQATSEVMLNRMIAEVEKKT